MQSQLAATAAGELAAQPPSDSKLAFFAASRSYPVTGKPAPMSRRASASPNSPSPINPTRLRSEIVGITSRERFDAEIARRCIEACAQRFGHGHTALRAFQALAVALLAGKPDALDARQPLRPAHRAHGDIAWCLKSSTGANASIESATTACPV